MHQFHQFQKVEEEEVIEVKFGKYDKDEIVIRCLCLRGFRLSPYSRER
jgi:hypothetical protein